MTTVPSRKQLTTIDLPRGYKLIGNTITLTDDEHDSFSAYNYSEYVQDLGDRNLYVYGGDGKDFFYSDNFFRIQDGSLCPCGEDRAGSRYAFYDKDDPVTLNYFGEDGDDFMYFYKSGSSKLYGGSGNDSAMTKDGILFKDYKLIVKPHGVKFKGTNKQLKPSATSTFISEDVEFVYGPPEGGYLMSDLMRGKKIYYTDDELKVIRSQMEKGDTNYTIIKSVRGKGKLRGSNSANAFTFDRFERFTKKGVDKIIGFDSSERDTIAVSSKAFPELKGISEIKFASTNSKKELKLLSRQDYDFVYFEKKGRLYFDGNGADKGWGNSSEGGLFAIMTGKPELNVRNFTLLD